MNHLDCSRHISIYFSRSTMIFLTAETISFAQLTLIVKIFVGALTWLAWHSFYTWLQNSDVAHVLLTTTKKLKSSQFCVVKILNESWLQNTKQFVKVYKNSCKKWLRGWVEMKAIWKKRNSISSFIPHFGVEAQFGWGKKTRIFSRFPSRKFVSGKIVRFSASENSPATGVIKQ